MTRTNNDDEVPLISFVPEEHKPDKERISSFKVYSTPGNTSTTRYDFTIFHIDGNESLGILLNFKRQVQKLKVATAATSESSAPAFKNVVEALCHEPARTAFSQDTPLYRSLIPSTGSTHGQLLSAQKSLLIIRMHSRNGLHTVTVRVSTFHACTSP